MHRFFPFARVDDVTAFIGQRVVKRDQRTHLDHRCRFRRGLSGNVIINKQYRTSKGE